MAIFGAKKKKDEGPKTSPLTREPAGGRFEVMYPSQNHAPPQANGRVPPAGYAEKEKPAYTPQGPPLRPMAGQPYQESSSYRGTPDGGAPAHSYGQQHQQLAQQPLASQPPPGPPPAAPSSSSEHAPSQSRNHSHAPGSVIYPWSHRRLGLLPPAPFPNEPETRGSAGMRPSPSPFPRYGHSVNAMTALHSKDGTLGDLYIFGGLVADQIRNDLYVLNVAPLAPGLPPQAVHNQILTVGLVETRGEVPRPRIGHASVAVGNVLIIWGGDTKTAADPVQDPGLYLLNLTTREWTRVKVSGAMPEGRYGHAAAIVGSRFFVFGGQTDDGGFRNDMWSFDLQNRARRCPL